eukprot:CAMPEP_0182445202 /NCGR_PEP_ID=MMETSP1172-20130603/3414_1 /TAXON_ID=708627 /ORGANISM="Timspurckia oligopyrenoides, Strain CCMP3278" /LENGTH=745 /DNA_ID=CAMNT_0024640933 /DNA_START=1622 /DNA_END=3859 /DNA_ORIENTATION=+
MEDQYDGERRIQRLSDDVVRCIAAGEVIHDISGAVKELIENSIDAKSTEIEIHLYKPSSRNPNTSLGFHVIDNGIGIDPSDLAMIGKFRHCTSKLRSIHDLNSIQTFGFRGEALASIAQCSKLTITSMKRPHASQNSTHQHSCGYQLKLSRTAQDEHDRTNNTQLNPDVLLCKVACVYGTRIEVSDLFYNLPLRQRLLSRSFTDQLKNTVKLIEKYAAKYHQIAFLCKLFSSPGTPSTSHRQNTIVRTLSSASLMHSVTQVFGQKLARDLIPLSFACPLITDHNNGFNRNGVVTGSGYASCGGSGMHQAGEFVLFINGRLVEMNELRRRLFDLYRSILVKSQFPWILLDLYVSSEYVDVNVHPNKSQVSIAYLDQFLDHVTNSVSNAIIKTQNSKTFYTQSLMLDKRPLESEHIIQQNINASKREQYHSKHVPSHHQIRTHAHEPIGAMSHFIRPSSSSISQAAGHEEQQTQNQQKQSGLSNGNARRSRLRTHGAPVLLDSIYELIEERNRDCHGVESDHELNEVCEMFRESSFVGILYEFHDCFMLLQFRTSLVLTNVKSIVHELVFRHILHRFHDLPKYTFTPKIPLSSLMNQFQSTSDEDLLSFTDVAMLNEYFSIEFGRDDDDREWYLMSVPKVFEYVEPSVNYLKEFVKNVVKCCQKEKGDEKLCFELIINEIAQFYANQFQHHDGTCTNEHKDMIQSCIQHEVLRILKIDTCLPSQWMTQGVIRELTTLDKLYKVFERC